MQGAFEFHRDLPAKPERPERLFFALQPDNETAQHIARFRERFMRARRLDGTRLRTECLHVSLHHVGDYRRLRPKVIYAATLAADAVALPRFELTFRLIRTFDLPAVDGTSRKRPLVLLGEGEGARTLHAALGVAMAKIGLRMSAHFMPHMTLLYGVQSVPIEAIEPIRCAVDAFALIHSELRLTRHTVIARWPLAASTAVTGF